MIGNILIFALGLAGMIIFSVGWVYVAMYIIVGWANASDFNRSKSNRGLSS